ncbi:MAG: glycosyltransferase family 4 protein [Deltaproteobacteria bacterium]|nr:glycosyltransferase family 4 protein [Deltaproteobacteria bacterium]
MRIAFIGQKGFPASWGGVEVHVDNLARRLRARGHDVTIYNRRWYSENRPSEAGVRRITLPTLRGKHLDATFHSLLSSAHAAAVRHYDVIHYHAIGPALFSLLPRLSVRGIVTTVHGQDYQRDKWGPLARTALRLGEQAALRISDRTIVVSKSLRDAYRAQGYQVEYIPNGVSAPQAVEAADILELGLEPGGFVLSMSRWVPEKRVRELVAARAARPSSDLPLVVAGQADDPDYQRAVRSAAGGCRDIVFPGMVGGRLKDELLGHCRAFITASAVEGLPIALLEAMAAGKPVIASEIEPHRELLGELGDELLFPVDQPDRGLAMLASASFDGVGDGLAEVAAHYSWDECVDRVEEVYAELLGEA